MDHYFRQPWSAALIAAAVTMVYIYSRNKMNGKTNVSNSEYAKPAFLVAALTWLIVSQGCGQRESVSLEPF
jgi:uncharacterized membrane protein YphA (DoxX/SURF4 family)